MPQTLWSPSLVLAIYLNRRAPASRFVQMATVRPDGRPANRTLVFRGFLNDTSQLTFVTDLRSSKLADLAQSAVGRSLLVLSGDARTISDRRPDHRGRSRYDRSRAVGGSSSNAGGQLPEPTRLSFTWPASGEPRDAASRFPPSIPTPKFRCLISVCSCSTLIRSTFSRSTATRKTAGRFHRDDPGRWSGC